MFYSPPNQFQVFPTSAMTQIHTLSSPLSLEYKEAPQINNKIKPNRITENNKQKKRAKEKAQQHMQTQRCTRTHIVIPEKHKRVNHNIQAKDLNV